MSSIIKMMSVVPRRSPENIANRNRGRERYWEERATQIAVMCKLWRCANRSEARQGAILSLQFLAMSFDPVSLY